MTRCSALHFSASWLSSSSSSSGSNYSTGPAFFFHALEHHLPAAAPATNERDAFWQKQIVSCVCVCVFRVTPAFFNHKTVTNHPKCINRPKATAKASASQGMQYAGATRSQLARACTPTSHALISSPTISGYIKFPHASSRVIAMFAQRLRKSCQCRPARSRKQLARTCTPTSHALTSTLKISDFIRLYIHHYISLPCLHRDRGSHAKRIGSHVSS